MASPVSCDASVQARDRERREQQAVFLGYLGHRHISAAITQVLHRFRTPCYLCFDWCSVPAASGSLRSWDAKHLQYCVYVWEQFAACSKASVHASTIRPTSYVSRLSMFAPYYM